MFSKVCNAKCLQKMTYGRSVIVDFGDSHFIFCFKGMDFYWESNIRKNTLFGVDMDEYYREFKLTFFFGN